VDFVEGKKKQDSSSALLLWALFSILNKGCAVDEDTEASANSTEKVVLLKTWGSAAAEQHCFLQVKIGLGPKKASLDCLGSDVSPKSLSQLQSHSEELICQKLTGLFWRCYGDTLNHEAPVPWLETSMPRLKSLVPCCAQCMSR